MRCSSCASENPEGSKFCIECAAPLCKRCTSCGVENLPEAKFCAQCGKSLTAQAGPKATESAVLPDSGREAERRQLTVMFCDPVGSTALSAQLDPEELRAVVRAYQQTSAAVIERYGGYIAQYLGDGLLVYFGYPVAHEDDAARAVRAGLEIVGAPQHRTVGATPVAHSLQIRIGIHTGPVVVGEMGGGSRHEQLALGETPNIAARVQGLAEPDSVVVSAATQRLVAGLFNCEDLGPRTLKGISTPISAYRVSSEGVAQSRFDAAMHEGLTPLVGRAEELALLQRRWEQAKSGAGQVVLLSGEPGIGKSRLAQELKDQLAHDGVTRIEFRCSPYHENSAFYPIIEQLQRMLAFAREDTSAAKLEKLQHMLSRYRFPQADTVPLIAALLSLPHPESSPRIAVSPQKQKEKTQAAVVAWLLEEAEQKTVYNTWEDMHWADPSTLEVLNLVVDQAPTASLYVLLTFRPEFTPPWGNRSHVSQITLSRLGRSQVEAMVECVTGGKALPPEVMHQVVVKTDGVPLFVEELAKAIVESGLLTAVNDHYELRGPLPPLAIPSTLQASLLARLDRLAAVKEIAQLGATIGREFSYELLHAVSPLDEAMLQHGLKQLVEAELVYQHGLLPRAHYLFKHVLIQDAAYQSLLKSKRHQYHKKIGQVLEEKFPDTKETQPELVAHHYTEARLVQQALPYWLKAGQVAAERSAHAEAIGLLSAGLDLLRDLPETAERDRWELAFQTALLPQLVAARGDASPEVGTTIGRAAELCHRLGAMSQLFPVQYELTLFHWCSAHHRAAQAVATDFIKLARAADDPVALHAALNVMGGSSYWLGEFEIANSYFEEGMSFFSPERHRDVAFIYEPDPTAGGLGYWGFTLWSLGYPDQALQRTERMLGLAQELTLLHPSSLAMSLGHAAIVHSLRGEASMALARAEAGLALANEHGLRGWKAIHRTTICAVLSREDREGILKLQDAVNAYWATGFRVANSITFASLALAFGERAQFDEAERAMDEAFSFIEEADERAYEAEVHRLKGELLLMQDASHAARAEECFRGAIEIARRQRAKSWELRATISLAGLLVKHRRRKEARAMLAEIHGWFTEGFDTADLKGAKALLEELS
jgi:class 3 adenylate cyclase/tetratricopeptide (TPR) repeat protein